MKKVMQMFLALVVLLLFVFPIASPAATIWDQQYGGGDVFIPSQNVTDFDAYSAYGFDDFMTTQTWLVNSLIVPGTDYTADLSIPVSVHAQILTGLPGSGSVVLSSTGGTKNSDGSLSIDFGGQSLAAGDYWISAWMEGPYFDEFNPQTLWLWNATAYSFGSEAHWYNPGGGFAIGPDPIGVSAVLGEPFDLAFTLEGTATAVPEPSIMLLFGSGLLGLAALRKTVKN